MIKPKPDRFHGQQAIMIRNQQKILLALKYKPLPFSRLKDETELSAPQLIEHLKRLEAERIIEKINGTIEVTNRKGTYIKQTKLYSLTDKGLNIVKQVWWIIHELERMYRDVKIDKTLPDSERKIQLAEYSGHSQSSEWGAMFYPYKILIHSNKIPEKNFKFLFELKESFITGVERRILERICLSAINDRIISLNFNSQINNPKIWTEISRKISNEYLLDDRAEIFVGFHIKIKDLKTWLLSNRGINGLRAVLTDTPFPIDDGICVTIGELKPLIDITDKDLLDKMDLHGLPIPKLSLRDLMYWFQYDPNGRKYFSKFAPKEQDEIKAHSIPIIGWKEMLKWLMSDDGQIYLKALSKIAPFPHQFHMFISKKKGRWAITLSKKVQTVCAKDEKDIEKYRLGVSQ